MNSIAIAAAVMGGLGLTFGIILAVAYSFLRVEEDPLFVDTASWNFHLKAGSPAIDAGTSAGKVKEIMDKYYNNFGVSIEVDFDGNPRPLGSPWDIGAYEYP